MVRHIAEDYTVEYGTLTTEEKGKILVIRQPVWHQYKNDNPGLKTIRIATVPIQYCMILISAQACIYNEISCDILDLITEAELNCNGKQYYQDKFRTGKIKGADCYRRSRFSHIFHEDKHYTIPKKWRNT